MRQCQVSGKAKDKGRSKVITNSSPNKAIRCFCSLSLNQALLLKPSLSCPTAVHFLIFSSPSSSPHPVLCTASVHTEHLLMCQAAAAWPYVGKSGVCSLHQNLPKPYFTVGLIRVSVCAMAWQQCPGRGYTELEGHCACAILGFPRVPSSLWRQVFGSSGWAWKGAGRNQLQGLNTLDALWCHLWEVVGTPCCNHVLQISSDFEQSGFFWNHIN